MKYSSRWRSSKFLFSRMLPWAQALEIWISFSTTSEALITLSLMQKNVFFAALKFFFSLAVRPDWAKLSHSGEFFRGVNLLLGNSRGKILPFGRILLHVVNFLEEFIYYWAIFLLWAKQFQSLFAIGQFFQIFGRIFFSNHLVLLFLGL